MMNICSCLMALYDGIFAPLMDLPSGFLVEFSKRFSTRKKRCINFLIDAYRLLGRQILEPDGFTFRNFDGIFEAAIFYEKKVVRQLFDRCSPTFVPEELFQNPIHQCRN